MNKIYVDTSTDLLCIGLRINDEERIFVSTARRRMAEELVLVLKEQLNAFELDLSNIDEIYVTRGPGSYTGSRLGLTLAKTLWLLNPHLRVYLTSTLLALLKCHQGAELAIISMRNDSFYVLDVKEEEARRVELDELLKISQDRKVVILDSDESGYQKLVDTAEVFCCQLLEGMMKDSSIYELVEDPNKIIPYYLRG